MTFLASAQTQSSVKQYLKPKNAETQRKRSQPNENWEETCAKSDRATVRYGLV